MPELCLKVTGEPAPRLREALPSAPPTLERVILRCLEKDPANRYENARTLTEALERALDSANEDVEVVRHGATTKKRHRALVMGAVVAAILGVASVAWRVRARETGTSPSASQTLGAGATAEAMAESSAPSDLDPSAAGSTTAAPGAPSPETTAPERVREADRENLRPEGDDRAGARARPHGGMHPARVAPSASARPASSAPLFGGRMW
jgi:eukaryotic-like serine/threonine-protein kinase